jgi:hypothetical protein
MANQLPVGHFHGGASPQVGNLAHAYHRMCHIEAGSDVGMRKHGRVLDHSAAVYVRVMFDGGAARDQSAGANPRRRSDVGRRQNARAAFDDGAGRDPHSRPGLPSARFGFRLQSKHVHCKLAEIANIAQWIDITGMKELATLNTTLAEPAAKKGSRVVTPRRADAKNFGCVNVVRHACNAIGALQMKLD